MAYDSGNEKPKASLPEGMNPIDWLSPKSEQHEWMLQYLVNRIRFSRNKMSAFHPRWRMNELMLQAYISLPDYDQMLQDVQRKKGNPGLGSGSPVAINVPFAWSTINTIVTYLMHMFAGRSPLFEVGSYRSEQVNRAQNMELFLQYNADYMRFIRNLYFFLMDGEAYGLSVMRTMWTQQRKTRTIMMPPAPELVQVMSQLGQQAQGTPQKQEYVSFEGNTIANIDPFMFNPDPRVPMYEVNEKGEWVFWTAFAGKHMLLKEQAAGRLKWVDKVEPGVNPSRLNGDTSGSGASYRGMRSLGDSVAGERTGRDYGIDPNYQIDQGTIELIPADCGLGTSNTPEKWLFTILNETQIVQAIPVELPSGKHPVVVAEPNAFGYSFGQLGTVDMLGPMQELMSWFMNSHIYNVRSALNNMFVVDPSKVEMQDFRNPEPGKLIRMKNTAFGLVDPKSAVFQLQVTDVTKSHMQDFQMFGRLAADLTGATENARGLQDAGDRKTATEIRTSAEAGASRLAAKGKVYSAMAITDLASQWATNTQSNLTSDFELNVLGKNGQQNSVRITPDNLSGDFFFPVHDGTLPIDKVGLLSVWTQIFQAVLADPELRSGYDIFSMFDFIAQLGGGQNIKSFKLNQVPTGQGMEDVASGRGIPLQNAKLGQVNTNLNYNMADILGGGRIAPNG